MASPTIHHGWFSRIGAAELRRRSWHMMPGLIPFIVWFFPHRDPISPTMRLLLVIFTAILGGRIVLQYAMIRRGAQDTAGAAVLGYALSFLFTAWLFPADLEIAMAVLAILAFGDGSATFAGLTIPSSPLPWNRKKSWAGILGFVVVGLPIATLAYWGESHNLEASHLPVSLATALVCVTPAVFLCAIAESLPVRINDNIRVGVTASVSVLAMHTLLVG